MMNSFKFNKKCFSKSISVIWFFLLLLFATVTVEAQQYSTARIWNEMVLNGIRNDFARPTIHARNLFHTSIAMYDAFAAYDDINETYFLGKTIGGFTCEFEGVSSVESVQAAREMAMSYAVYRIIEERFKDSPGREDIFFNADLVLSALGYDRNYTSTNYENGNPAALGNYIAQKILEFGLQDGSNESNDYANLYYEPVNPDLNPFWTFDTTNPGYGNPPIVDPNRWQKLEIPNFMDQAGNIVEGGSPPFLGPEWGRVQAFALTESDLTIKERDGNEWWVYHDPGVPCYLDTLSDNSMSAEYKWGFSMVANWKTHTIMDSTNLIDISPNGIGNLGDLPTTIDGLRDFYDYENGGDNSPGHGINPITGQVYQPQMVPLADYAKLVAEWWADGPESETPPGHWFSILNYVNDQDALVKQYKGTGEMLTDLEWDVKSYLTMGGAMHDAAVSAWGIKGYYDYIRPISAIRYMVEKGQSSNPNAPNYDINGMPLIPGVIEQILDGDPLLFFDGSNYGAIKILSSQYEGTNFFSEGKYWLPYQDIGFVTPPFAGYVSGHSTYSRAAAEVLTLLTGSEYFPNGMGEFFFEEGSFELDNGPSMDLSLQWATYRDAANQSGLSRIWGGIHPPVDDIPGRIIGEKVGIAAFELADGLFGEGDITGVNEIQNEANLMEVFPNPVFDDRVLNVSSDLLKENDVVMSLYDSQNRLILSKEIQENNANVKLSLKETDLLAGIYYLNIASSKGQSTKKIMILK